MLATILKPLLAAGALAAGVGLAAGGAQAATLTVVGGQLLGAEGVEIGGALYDVSFQDASCIALFGGCDAASDFPFSTAADAVAAAAALIDQVFLDGPDGAFDSQPFLTAGCNVAFQCNAYIPYDIKEAGPFNVRSAFAKNHSLETEDGPFTITGIAPGTIGDSGVYAVFTPAAGAEVPAPAAAWLLGLGTLLGRAAAEPERSRLGRPLALGLLATRQPFGFVALLGAMSLAGMMIKNAIVLIDEINLQRSEGKEMLPAILDSGVSRLRPVAMAASTTALGMTPLLFDAFFVSMAVTIMVGLFVATILTLIIVPVLYVIFFRIPSPKTA